MEFKDRIKELRQPYNLTPSQLGSAMNKSEGAIRSWETGRAKPDADSLIKLADHFHCSADYLLGISDSIVPYSQDATEAAISSLQRLIYDQKKHYIDNSLRAAEIESVLNQQKVLLKKIQNEIDNLERNVCYLQGHCEKNSPTPPPEEK